MSPVERVKSWACPHTSLALELAALGVAVTVVPDSVSVASLSAITFVERAEAPAPQRAPDSPRAGSSAPEGCGKPRDVVGVHEPRTGDDS